MFKNNLKLIRTSKGLSLRKLGEMTGLSHGNVHDIESGKIDLTTKAGLKLAKALGVTIEDLRNPNLPTENYPISKNKSNLALLREKAGLTQVEVAQKLGKTKQYISLLEKDVSKINESMKEQLAKVLKVNPDEITADPPQQVIPTKEMIYLPLYDYKLSAGKGIYKLNNAITDKDYTKIPIKIELLEKITISNINNLCLLIIDGDSMDPTFKDGDFAILDTSINELTSQGGIYAFDYDDESYIKRIQRTPDKLIIISDNPKYKEWFIDLPPKHTLKIWGKVKASMPINKV